LHAPWCQGGPTAPRSRGQEAGWCLWPLSCKRPRRPARCAPCAGVPPAQEGVAMPIGSVSLGHVLGMRRRELLKAGLTAGAVLSTWPLSKPTRARGAEAGQPKRGGMLRLRGLDPVHFDHHLTVNFKTNSTLSFTHSRLVRHKVGAEVPPGTFIVEPDLAERWEQLDDTTYVFYLRKGVKWPNTPPVNGRELVAEDVKSTFDRFLTEKGNQDRELLQSVDRVEVVDRYTVKFLLKEPYVWLINTLAYSLKGARDLCRSLDLMKKQCVVGSTQL